ncbi:hypothetical protein XA68_14285 [Ophiocordyceps unilateralis]|uniref:DUF8035 domain-containing protein n=1 Tax=Ophiocordyceps unilateralis TaxID=268505 RepID=A0A2A9PN42_OPHUN|nr:hypothetical protein XA68_14285 [Ophiocordyceps unilateralis]
MNGSAALRHIDAVDAFSRTLFLRAQQHRASSLSDIPAAVHQLHIALRHLRVEAADPDSPLNGGPDQSSLASRVQPLVRECESSLKQLESLLDKCDASSGRHSDSLVDRVAAVRVRLDNDAATIDMLLDSVQLPSPTDRVPVRDTPTNGPDLERIKDKVDAIAARLFSRRALGGAGADANVDDDRLWWDFKSELEKEGFAPQVLQQHKGVLRAYIRELENTSSLQAGGVPPTVRGLLEKQQAKSRPVPPKESTRLLADDAPHPSREIRNESHSFSSNDGANSMTDSMALISTRDLVTTDSIQSGMASLHLHPQAQNLSSSSRGAQRHVNSGEPPTPALAARPESWTNPSPLGTSPATARGLSAQSSDGSVSRASSRLAPDRYGKEIPMDAQWTRIRRSLVSPEVLARAGVRYEARPDFVAVLGCLSRTQIAEYAEQSAKCRASRSNDYVTGGQQDKRELRPRSDSKSSRDEDDDESVLWDESDSTDYVDDKTSDKGDKNYPYIVSPPPKDKASPASTVMPKPILKNKNENHVRFDPEPHEVEPKTPRYSSKDERDQREDYVPRRQREYRERDGSGGSREGHGLEGDRRGADGDRHRGSRRHDTNEDYRRPHPSDRDRRGPRRSQKKKKAWDALGVVGIGGAAASLLGSLTEAAIGM